MASCFPVIGQWTRDPLLDIALGRVLTDLLLTGLVEPFAAWHIPSTFIPDGSFSWNQDALPHHNSRIVGL